jgi:hypothetical protein
LCFVSENGARETYFVDALVHVWRSGLLWDSETQGPQGFRELILQEDSTINFDQYRCKTCVTQIEHLSVTSVLPIINPSASSGLV